LLVDEGLELRLREKPPRLFDDLLVARPEVLQVSIDVGLRDRLSRSVVAAATIAAARRPAAATAELGQRVVRVGLLHRGEELVARRGGKRRAEIVRPPRDVVDRLPLRRAVDVGLQILQAVRPEDRVDLGLGACEFCVAPRLRLRARLVGVGGAFEQRCVSVISGSTILRSSFKRRHRKRGAARVPPCIGTAASEALPVVRWRIIEPDHARRVTGPQSRPLQAQHMHVSAAVAGNDGAGIGRERAGRHLQFCGERGEKRARGEVPRPYGPVVGNGRCDRQISRQGDGIDRVGMTGEYLLLGSEHEIPHP
jgi:hypothetical protein